MTGQQPTKLPSCCPDAYWCGGEIECPRHSGFTVCCDRPDLHISQSRAVWDQQMADYERGLLDAHCRATAAAEESP